MRYREAFPSASFGVSIGKPSARISSFIGLERAHERSPGKIDGLI
jgi:hypothetical protein